MPTELLVNSVNTPNKYAMLWRAAHLCGQLPTIHVHIDVWPMYSINSICNANCVRKYTSIYLLLSTNLFAFVFRVLLYWRPEWSDTQPNRPTTAAACNNQAAATTTNSDWYTPQIEGALFAKKVQLIVFDFAFPRDNSEDKRRQTHFAAFFATFAPKEPPNLTHKW